MSRSRAAFRLEPHPEFTRELQDLAARAVAHPRGPEDRLLRVTLNRLQGIQHGDWSTHQLDYMPSYPDLSDCETTYVGADPNSKPSHRIVWRERSRPDPDGTPVRQIIALGERAYGQAYHLAGARLGRPVGITLEELRAMDEPISRAPRNEKSRRHPAYAPSIPIEYSADEQHSEYGN